MATATFDPEELASHAEGMRRLALGLLGDASAAEDAVQQTFLAALEHPPDADRPLRPWLARVLRNHAFDTKRRTRRRSRREVVATSRQENESQAPEEVVERAESVKNAVDAVLELPEPYRETLLLRYVEDLSAVEIGRRLGQPDATVRTHVRRGLEMLRERLDARDERGWRAACAVLLLPLSEPGAAPPPASGGIAQAAPWLAGALLVVSASVFAWPSRSDARPDDLQRIEESMDRALLDEGHADAVGDRQQQLSELGYSD